MHAVDHGDLASAEVICLSVGHGDLHVVSREGRQGRHRRRLQDYHLSTTDDQRPTTSHATPSTFLVPRVVFLADVAKNSSLVATFCPLVTVASSLS